MVIRIMFVLMLTLFGCSGLSSQPLSRKDVVLGALATSATLIDWRQTNLLIERQIPELNPILGAYPSKRKVNILIPLAVAGQWGVTRYIDPKYRPMWQWFLITVESTAIHRNYTHCRIRIDF